MWYRVFGTNDASIDPGKLLEHLQGLGFAVRGHFRGDDQGWFACETVVDDEARIQVNRYLSTEEGIRADLNSWAAWIETTDCPQRESLMERVIGTRQLLTVHDPDSESADLCRAICRYIAEMTSGMIQEDGQGLIAADATVLVKEA